MDKFEKKSKNVTIKQFCKLVKELNKVLVDVKDDAKIQFKFETGSVLNVTGDLNRMIQISINLVRALF